MRLNTKPETIHTHEGAPAKRINALQQLRRSVCSAFLWEREFYEDGETIAERVMDLSKSVSMKELGDLAVECRKTHNLRHMPLLLLACMVLRCHKEGLSGKEGNMIHGYIGETIGRADELCELLAILCKVSDVSPDNLKTVLTKQVKVGLAQALKKFDAYQLGKYNRKNAITIRDVICLTHPKPDNEEQSALWKSILDGTLRSPDTWEVNLSKGADKKETFTRLIAEGKLGYMALLRNLRGMMEAGVDESLVEKAILARKGAGNVLPFRFVSAARACPQLERPLDMAMVTTIGEMPKLEGTTAIVVDVSGSMFYAKVSSKSEITRADAAATLASMVNGKARVFPFAFNMQEVPHRVGMSGVDAILNCDEAGGGTNLGEAVRHVNQMIPHDRIIVITDEQSWDHVPDPVADKAYLINVASYKNGVGYGKWVHMDGFSENTLKFILEYEAL